MCLFPRSNGMGIHRMLFFFLYKIWDLWGSIPLEWKVWLTPWKDARPCVGLHVEIDHCGCMVRAYIQRSVGKNGLLAFLVSGSLMVIEIDMDGSDTYDFVYNVLVIHSSYTIFHKKMTPYLIGHNFGKCWSIFKFFHPRTQQRSCNELIIKDPSLLKGVDTLPCEM